MLGDFSVLIAIVLMSAWNAYLKLDTPTLHVPTEFRPTRPNDREWIVPFFGKNPFWTIPVAIVPALIATVLIFMDQQITAVIINRKEFKLKVKFQNSYIFVFKFKNRKKLAIIWIYLFYRLRFLFNPNSVSHGLLQLQF